MYGYDVSLNKINEFRKFVMITYTKKNKLIFHTFIIQIKFGKKKKNEKTNNGKMIRTISNLLLQWQTHFLRTFYEHINHVIDQKHRLHQ